jgi:alpha-tubulin suppressor-like RCC1 family protein
MSSTPLEVVLPAGDPVLDIAAGPLQACTLHQSGRIRCWGARYDVTPAEIAAPVGVKAVAVGEGFVCMVTQAGGVACLGKNEAGQLGSGMPTASATPVAVPGITTGATAVAAGANHVCAIVATAVICWGQNGANQTLAGKNVLTTPPVTIGGLPPAVAIGAGANHTCALTSAREVYCWGENGGYQLGDGTNLTRATPVKVVALP